MNGIILVPTFYKKRFENPYKLSKVLLGVITSIQNYFGFDIQYVSNNFPDIPKDTKLVIAFCTPYHNRPELIPGLLDLDKNVKLINYVFDLQCYDNKNCLENRIKIFEKSNLIIGPNMEIFNEWYPQYMEKFGHVPSHFFPYDRYVKLKFNKTPIMRCLLSGSNSKEVYPFRYYIKTKGNKKKIDVRDSKYKKFNEYPAFLNRYFCCITSPSVYNYVATKHFEIPAAGSLLLARRIKDLDNLGFIPNEHYVPVNKKNVFDKIDDCIRNPEKYNNIRKNGHKFVLENHNENVRMKKLEKIFEEKL